MANKTGYRGAIEPLGTPILEKFTDNGDGTWSAGAGATPTIAGPLDRRADALSVSVALSTEDVALLTSGQIVGGTSPRITPTITVDTAVYAAGDCVGGKIVLTGMLRATGKGGVLQDIHILDRSNQKPTGNLLIFHTDPAMAGTPATMTDNAAFVYGTADLFEIARIAVASADYVTINSKATAHLRNIGAEIKAASGVDLWLVFVTDGAPDFVAATDLQISFGVLQD